MTDDATSWEESDENPNVSGFISSQIPTKIAED